MACPSQEKAPYVANADDGSASNYGSSYCKIYAKRASPPQGSAHVGGNQAPLDELANSALHTARDRLWLGGAVQRNIYQASVKWKEDK